MNISVAADASTADIVKTVQTAAPGSVLVCLADRQYALLKIAMVKLQRSDLSVEQHDAYGVAIRQVVARKKAAPADSVPEAAVPQAVAETAAETQAPSEPSEPSEKADTSSADTDNDTAADKGVTAAVAEPPVGTAAVSAQGDVQASIHPDIRAAQVRAVKALEEAFKLCRASELSVIGFSDGLVAIPKAFSLSMEALSSTDAFDIDAMDVYQGFEADEDAEPVS